MKKILIDNRWSGTGGIGTFAHETNKINCYDNACFTGKPYSPLDAIRLTLKTAFTRNKVFFFPGYIPPLYSGSPYVITIHDLNHLDRKENSSLMKRIFYRLVIMRGCKKAKYIFTVSEFSKARIIDWAGVREDKVINVGNGVSDAFSPDGDEMGYPFEYILCVSNRKAHKNEIGTLEAFKKAKLPGSLKLVFTGKENEFVKRKIKELDIEDKVIFTGFIEQEELPKIYRGAKALIFVSFYEGFGLPVLEAMASGVPVITSSTSSLGEIAGSAAYLVNPENVNEISKAIYDINNDERLRKDLINKGLLQSKNYSWEKTAYKIDLHLNSI